MTRLQPASHQPALSTASEDGNESMDNLSVSTRSLMLGAGVGVAVPRHAVVDLAVCNSGEDSLAVLTASGEVLTLDMAVLHEREEKQVDEIVGHSDEPVRPIPLLYS